MLFQKKTLRSISHWAVEFQSLFCWMLFQKTIAVIFIFQFEAVSILILLDVISEASFCNCTVLINRVSILILLDVISEAHVPVICTVTCAGFNPYSVGCYFRSKSWKKEEKYEIKFQSLFCWMLFQKRMPTP